MKQKSVLNQIGAMEDFDDFNQAGACRNINHNGFVSRRMNRRHGIDEQEGAEHHGHDHEKG
jgi:hypothetical protein